MRAKILANADAARVSRLRHRERTSISCWRSTDKGRAARDFDTGIARALEALLSSPKFVLRVEQEPLDAAIRRRTA